MDFLKFRFAYFAFSGIFIIAALGLLIVNHLHLGIDFTGGFFLEIKTERSLDNDIFYTQAEKLSIDLATVQSSGEKMVFLRGKTIDQEKKEQFLRGISEQGGVVEELRFEQVGPTIGAELTRNSFRAIGFAALAILGYITYAFRTVPKPARSIRFAVCTIVALIHDVVIVLGAFALFGRLWNVEVDTLFVTAILTVIGYSVHDTIVVFDRIRENLRKHRGHAFAAIVNLSLLQTLNRSLTTTVTVVFVLLGLLLFGGTSIYWFVVALLIGIISGTYSSLFVATPLLVVWQEWSDRRKSLKNIA